MDASIDSYPTWGPWCHDVPHAARSGLNFEPQCGALEEHAERRLAVGQTLSNV